MVIPFRRISRESKYFEQIEFVPKKARKDPDRLEHVQVLQEFTCGTNLMNQWNVVFFMTAKTRSCMPAPYPWITRESSPNLPGPCSHQ
jgi:hypothetical protein